MWLSRSWAVKHSVWLLSIGNARDHRLCLVLFEHRYVNDAADLMPYLSSFFPGFTGTRDGNKRAACHVVTEFYRSPGRLCRLALLPEPSQRL